jgi:hypothetical protein
LFFNNRGEFRAGDYEEIMSESAVERGPGVEHNQDWQYRWAVARSVGAN